MPPKDDPLFEALQVGGHALPALWRYLLPEEMSWHALPQERLANCAHCYWVRLGRCRDDCRCCTYFPQLPNFLIGLALKDPSSRSSMQTLLESQPPLPLGLLATPGQTRDAVAMQAEDRFGEDPTQVCPFFGNHGRCAIHAHRNSICATFFCAHDHGTTGTDVWQALQALVGYAETVLGQWAMDEVGISSRGALARLDTLADDIDALYDAQDDRRWSVRLRETLWGDWWGREQAFFEACADAVMAHRDELYAIAAERSLLEARRYDHAVSAWLPAPLRAAAPAPSTGEAIPLPELWYRLQLKLRQLAALPFGEGTVLLAPGMVFAINTRAGRFAAAHDQTHRLRGPDGTPLLFCDAHEVRALELFATPQVLGEDLFARPEIEALGDPRRRLAEWMRRGLLVTRTGSETSAIGDGTS